MATRFKAVYYLSIVAAVWSTPAWSKGKLVHSLPGGIIFPEFLSAPAQNPAALGYEDATALGVLYMPPNSTSTTEGYAGAFGTSFSNFGMGATYSRYDYPTSGTNSQTVSAGAGFQTQSLGLGLGYVTAVATGTSTGTGSLNMGLVIGNGKGPQFGFVLYNMNAGSYAEFGFGYADPKHYNLEASLQCPPFSTGLTAGGSTYALHVSAATYAGSFGLSFGSGYSYTLSSAATGSTSYSSAGPWNAALLFRLAESLLFSVRTDTASQLSLMLTIDL